MKKKNIVIDMIAHDITSLFSNRRRLSVRIIRQQGDKRKAQQYILMGASRRRMLRVLEAMP